MSKTQIFILLIQICWFNMQNIDILESYPKHTPLQSSFICKPYDQVFTELPETKPKQRITLGNYCVTKELRTVAPFLYTKLVMQKHWLPHPGVVRMMLQLSTIRGRSSSTWSTGVVYTRAFRCPYRTKSRGLRSGDLAGHGTVPRWPFHLSPNVTINCYFSRWLKCAGAPSCWNHVLVRSASGSSSDNTGRVFTKKSL